MKLLIADDDVSTVEVITTSFPWEEMGVNEIFTALNGARAMEILERERPEMTICDIEMPRCNGLEVLQWAREHRIDTQFILLTCYADFEYAQSGIEYGAFRYITKPFSRTALGETLRLAVDAINRSKSEQDEERKKEQTYETLMEVSRAILNVALIERNDTQRQFAYEVEPVSPTRMQPCQYGVILMRFEGFDEAHRAEKAYVSDMARDSFLPALGTDLFSAYTAKGDTYLLILFGAEYVPIETVDALCKSAVKTCRTRRWTASCALCRMDDLEELAGIRPVLEETCKQIVETEPSGCAWLLLKRISEPDAIIRAKAYIKQHYRTRLSRQDIAQHTHFSPNYLSRLFAVKTGSTISEYINKCRIEEAKRLLADPNCSVTQIAADVGFDTVSYFSTAFSKSTGMSPIAWRHRTIQKQK